jgi:hypothetical protein
VQRAAKKTLCSLEAPHLTRARQLLPEGLGLRVQATECDRCGGTFGEADRIQFHQPARLRVDHQAGRSFDGRRMRPSISACVAIGTEGSFGNARSGVQALVKFR